jgi:hypothetical protein
VRYTTRIELEETAYENRNRRLEMHGFVDYYDAMSIYATPPAAEAKVAADREEPTEAIPGEEISGNLPAVFADSLLGGAFLMTAFEQITDPNESDRFAHELTALGNRILSANLVDLGEFDSIRPALEEMRDFLTIGLEYLTGGRSELGPQALRRNYIQTIFRIGFDQVARLRESADRLPHVRGFGVSMLDEPDQHPSRLCGALSLWLRKKAAGFEINRWRMSNAPGRGWINWCGGVFGTFSPMGESFQKRSIRRRFNWRQRTFPTGAREGRGTRALARCGFKVVPVMCLKRSHLYRTLVGRAARRDGAAGRQADRSAIHRKHLHAMKGKSAFCRRPGAGRAVAEALPPAGPSPDRVSQQSRSRGETGAAAAYSICRR